MDMRLMRLRLELFTAAQSLEGESLKEFWALIDDVAAVRIFHDPSRRQIAQAGTGLG